jgi:general secretion pathway protein E
MKCGGALTPALVLPQKSGQTAATLIGRLKVLARLPAYVIHEPQDGRIDWAHSDGAPVQIRVAFLPSPQGCLATLRFPMRDGRVLGPSTHGNLPLLDRLGMPSAVLATVHRLVSARDGLLALTGPAGSGKTTTLHAILVWLDQTHRGQLQMIAVEDPVERELPFATHVQVHQPTGLDFAVATRAALRHSPDALLIGELRDPETVQVALSAGMSGHLVLTTIHAGRAARVPGRLRALGAPPHLIASAFNGAVAQRLVAPEQSPPVALFEALEMDEVARTLVGDPDSFSGGLQRLESSVQPTLEQQAVDLIQAGILTEAAARMALGNLQLPIPSPGASHGAH